MLRLSKGLLEKELGWITNVWVSADMRKPHVLRRMFSFPPKYGGRSCGSTWGLRNSNLGPGFSPICIVGQALASNVPDERWREPAGSTDAAFSVGHVY